MFGALNISSTGLTAQRLRMDVISNNIANAGTTRGPEGDGPYRRQQVVMQPVNIRTRWKSPVYPFGVRPGAGQGVRVLKIDRDDTTPLRGWFTIQRIQMQLRLALKKGMLNSPMSL